MNHDEEFRTGDLSGGDWQPSTDRSVSTSDHVPSDNPHSDDKRGSERLSEQHHAAHTKLREIAGVGFHTDPDNEERARCGPVSAKEMARLTRVLGKDRVSTTEYFPSHERSQARSTGRAPVASYYVSISYADVEHVRPGMLQRLGWGRG